MAKDAVALLEVLNIKKAHIIGASMGGMITQIIALDHPEKSFEYHSNYDFSRNAK